MNITQDAFNKLVTLILLIYVMIMFSASWYTGKPIDLNGFLTLTAPIITHTVHLISNKFSDKGGSNGTH
jgi:hypothetical protein